MCVPLPVPLTVVIATGGSRIALIGAGIAGIVSAAGACARILENIAGGIIGKCLCTIRSIGRVDDLDPILAIVGKGTTIHVDNIGANTFDIHAVDFVPGGSHVVQRDIAAGSDGESAGTVIVERAVRNGHCGLAIEDSAFCSIPKSLSLNAHIVCKVNGTCCNDLQTISASLGSTSAGIGIFIPCEDAGNDIHLSACLDIGSKQLVIIGIDILKQCITCAYHFEASACGGLAAHDGRGVGVEYAIAD